MQPTSNGQLQWEKLERKSDNDVPPQDKCKKLFLSKDHLILLISEGSIVYTFNLKDFCWTKRNIHRLSTSSMSSNSCIVRPGLIADLNLTFGSLQSLELLTFDTEKVPKNFCQASKLLKNFSIGYIDCFTIITDSTSVYLFGGVSGLFFKYSEFKTIYQVKIGMVIVKNYIENIAESGEVDLLHIEDIKPCARSQHCMASCNDKIYIFGGAESNNNLIPDLWVFDLSKKEWKQLDDGKSGLQPKGATCIFAQQDQLLACSDEDGTSLTRAFNFSKSSWEPINSKTPECDYASNRLFAPYDNSLIYLCGSELYYLNNDLTRPFLFDQVDLSGPQKTKKCSEKIPDNFMAKLYENKTFADVIFQVEDQEFPANKFFLSVRCPYFNNVFTSNMMESQNKIIPVKNVRAEVFKVMLEYLYFIEVEVKCEIAEDLFKLCHEYGLENLKNDCEELLAKDIRVDNVIKKIQLAKFYGANQLRQVCLAFIVRNLDEVFLTQNIRDLDNETLLELHKIKA